MVRSMYLIPSKEACFITRILQRVLILFCERGVVIPFKDSSGQGSQRLFSFDNLVEIMIAEQMWRFKMNLRLIKKILDLWRDNYHKYHDKYPGKKPDVIIVRHLDSDWTDLGFGRREDFTGPFFDAEWVDKCSWMIIAGNDPIEKWKEKGMTVFTTMLIDVGTIKENLKEKIY